MSRLGASVIGNLLACAPVALALLGCGGDVDVLTEAAATQCTVVQPGPWTNRAFAAQTGRFRAELVATPSASGIDAVIGVSNGSAASFAKLAAAVRFGPAGTIDVRSGAEYRADVVVPYTAGTAYRVRLDIDVTAHTYSVAVQNQLGGWSPLASRYPFRTEQASVAQLDTLALKLDSSSGSLEACGLTIVPLDAAGCPFVAQGHGFVPLPVAGGDVVHVTRVTATPSTANLDAVLGLSSGPADDFDDLAAAVRFAPSGYLDVRDAAGYRADALVPYTAGRSYTFRIVADLPTHVYSVFVQPGDDANEPSIELAHRYTFRPSQIGVPRLDTVNLVVDSPAGAVGSCEQRASASAGIAYLVHGDHAIAPLSGDQVFVTDGHYATRYGARGETITSFPFGSQQLAASDAGDVYLISAVAGILSVDAYAGIAPRWSRTYPVPGDTAARGAALDAAGHIQIALGSASGLASVIRLAPDGTLVGTAPVSGTAIAFGRDGFAIGGGRTVERRAATGALVWRRTFTGAYSVDAIAMAPDGAVFFGGSYTGDVSFGGPLLTPHAGEFRHDSYAVGLTPAGDHRFTRYIPNTYVRSMATNGARIAVGGEDWVTPIFAHLTLLDPDGQQIGSDPWTGLDELSFSGTMAMGPTGRLYWHYRTPWPHPLLSPSYPFLLAIEP